MSLRRFYGARVLKSPMLRSGNDCLYQTTGTFCTVVLYKVVFEVFMIMNVKTAVCVFWHLSVLPSVTHFSAEPTASIFRVVA
jgi:hypothetical protein